MKESDSKLINKAVYVILKTYHRTHGIAVIGWSKPPGNRYYTFFSLAADPQEAITRYPLTIYQDRVGMPAWATRDRQEVTLDTRNVRKTAELLSFYRRHFQLNDYLAQQEPAIAAWREQYTVRQSEPFLLMWKVLGFLSSSLRWCVRTYGNSESYSLDALDPYRAAVQRLGVEDPDVNVHFCGNVAFCSDGRVIFPDGRSLDLWKEHLAGASPRELVERVLREC